MIKILKDSAAIHDQLSKMFCTRTRGRRRVAIVAYVGRDAPKLLDDYANVELYCWPQIGATDPNAIDKLLKMKSPPIIRFVDRLHMKLYWVETFGYIVTSANLSKNALQEDGLHEFGIFIDKPEALKIDHIIKSLPSRAVKESEMLELMRKHDLFWSRNATLAKRSTVMSANAPKTYPEWYETSHYKKPWKISIWKGHLSDREIESIKSKIGREIFNYVECKYNEYKEGDWILMYEDGKADDPVWLFIDAIQKRRKGDYKYLCIQYKKLKAVTEPFKIDRDFKRAFECVAKDLDDKCTEPSKELLDSLKAKYANSPRRQEADSP